MTVIGAGLLSAAGCATQSGGVPGHLSRASAEAASAAATGQLTMELFSDGRSTATATDTTLAAMLSELTAAEVAASTLVVETAADDTTRSTVMAAIRDASSAVVQARAVVTQHTGSPADPGVDAAATELEDATDILDQLATRLEETR